MKKFAFVIAVMGCLNLASLRLFASNLSQTSSSHGNFAEELEEDRTFNTQVYEKSLAFHEQDPLPMGAEYRKRFGLCGFVIAGLDLAFGLIATVPGSVVCTLVKNADCFAAAFPSGLLGGIGFVVTSAGLIMYTGDTYYQIHKENKSREHHRELALVLKTAFEYDESGMRKNTAFDDTEFLIDVQDPIRAMIDDYHKINSTYKISVAELAKRIRSAACAGYFISLQEFDIVGTPGNIGKWHDIKVAKLMQELALGESSLERFYATTIKDNKNFQQMIRDNAEASRAITGTASPFVALDIIR